MRQIATDPPLVSCVTIFLNGEAYIAEAIESVLAQTWRNWELVMVDDGTTDGATEIVRRYCAAHPDRIRLIAHPGGKNLGMSASRNAGFRASTGKYVTFLDADDVWLPDRLRAHVEMLEAHPEVAVSVAPTLFWKSWNRKLAPWWRPWACEDVSYSTGLAEGRVMGPPEVATHFLERRGGGVPGICSVTIRRSAFDAVGGSEDAFRILYEDQVLLFKLFLRFPVIAIDNVLALYRQHGESSCASEGGLAGDRVARPGFLAWLRNWIEAMDIRDPVLNAALESEIARAKDTATRFGRIGQLVGFWQIESRLAVIWMLTPSRYNRLRIRLGRSPLAHDGG